MTTATGDAAHNGGPIFIVGPMGSGTTLMRLIVDSHEHIAIAQETSIMRAYLAHRWIPFHRHGGDWYGRLGWSDDELDARMREFYARDVRALRGRAGQASLGRQDAVARMAPARARTGLPGRRVPRDGPPPWRRGDVGVGAVPADLVGRCHRTGSTRRRSRCNAASSSGTGCSWCATRTWSPTPRRRCERSSAGSTSRGRTGCWSTRRCMRSAARRRRSRAPPVPTSRSRPIGSRPGPTARRSSSSRC